MAQTATATKEPGRERLISVSTRLPPSLWRAIRIVCAEKGLGMQIFVQDALTQHLKRTRR